MTYTSTHPTVIWAERIYSLTSGHTEALAAVLTHHKHKLQGKLRQAQDLAAAEGREVVRLRVERDHWRAKAQSAAADAAVQAPVALREITDDDADAAQEIRDRLAASLPQWQPIVADDIKPGMLVRGAGCKYLIEGTVTEVSPSWITTSDASWITEGRTWEVDPRTVPTEPELVDPDTDAVEAMARAVCGDWDALPDSDRDDVRTEMRAALTAYRGWVEGDQS